MANKTHNVEVIRDPRPPSLAMWKARAVQIREEVRRQYELRRAADNSSTLDYDRAFAAADDLYEALKDIERSLGESAESSPLSSPR